ncbi:MAG: PaaI family thioesterase [Pseudomonadota bacterium]
MTTPAYALAGEPPAGWTVREGSTSFMQAIEPTWFAPMDADPLDGICGFVAEERHGNSIGVVHGGALLTLADIALWGAARRVVGPMQAFTVTLSSEFVAGAKTGQWVCATGELIRAGSKMTFARGVVYADGSPSLVYSGTLKRISNREPYTTG